MEIYLYKDIIDKANVEYSKLKKKLLIIGLVGSGIIILLVLVLLILSLKGYIGKDAFLCGLIVLPFLFVIYYIVFYSYKKNKFIYNELDKLIISILRLETDYDFSKKYDKNGYIAKIYDTRIARHSDEITLKSAFTFASESIKGDLFFLTISRRNQKSSSVILNGIVVSLALESNLDFQIRTDKNVPLGMKKIKDISTDSYTIFTDKTINPKDNINLNVINSLDWLKQNFDSKNVGIDFNKNIVSFYVSESDIFKMPHKLTSSIVEEICKSYLSYLRKTELFAEELEKQLKD